MNLAPSLASVLFSFLTFASLASSEDKFFHFINPQLNGIFFHSSVPPTKICTLLKAGPAVLYLQYGKTPRLRARRLYVKTKNNKLIVKIKAPRTDYIHVITCAAPQHPYELMVSEGF